MEPIVVQHFIHQRVSSLSAAVKSMFTGSAVVYTFDRPRSLFLGTLPRQAAVLWRYPNEHQLRIAPAGCTFFTWSHIVEKLVVTGLLRYKFDCEKLDVFVIFHVFDPIKFSSFEPEEQVHDLIGQEVRKAFANYDSIPSASPEYLHEYSELFFALNHLTRRHGVGVTQINPEPREPQ